MAGERIPGLFRSLYPIGGAVFDGNRAVKKEDGVVLDRSAQLRVHVLHGAGPPALEKAALVAE